MQDLICPNNVFKLLEKPRIMLFTKEELITFKPNLKPPSEFSASFVSGIDCDECKMLLLSVLFRQHFYVLQRTGQIIY